MAASDMKLEQFGIDDLDFDDILDASPAAADPQSVCLIVEPDQHIQRLLHTWLIELQVEHTQLNDSEQAISACSDFKYSIIFMDLDSTFSSSVRTGVDAARNIRWSDTGLNRSTPIIGLSMDEGMIARLPSFGVDDMLLKPFSKEMLAAVVHKWLGGVADILKIGSVGGGIAGTPPLDISQMAPPDFIISGLVKPRTARVLVVEDCKLTQHVIIGLLSKLTSNVQQAFDGEQAVEMCRKYQFDLILMDMAMPKLNGLEATRQIRSAGRNMYAPIVAFTSSGKLEDYTAYGVNDMLQKPFTKEMLSNIFDKWTAYIKRLDDPDSALAFGDGDAQMVDAGAAAAAAPQPPRPQIPAVDGGGGGAVAAAAAAAGGATLAPPKGGFASASASAAPKNHSYQPIGVGLPMPNLPFQPTSRAGKTGSGRRKTAKPRTIHNRKEQHRRKQITLAAEELSKMIPNLPAGDKATVLMSAVAYVRLLRESMDPATLTKVDAEFQPHVEAPDS